MKLEQNMENNLITFTKIKLIQQQIDENVDKRVQVFGWCHRVLRNPKSLPSSRWRRPRLHPSSSIWKMHGVRGAYQAEQGNRSVSSRESLSSPTSPQLDLKLQPIAILAAHWRVRWWLWKPGPSRFWCWGYCTQQARCAQRRQGSCHHQTALLHYGPLQEHFASKDFTEVTPPTIVNLECEGGSSLFKLDYYGQGRLWPSRHSSISSPLSTLWETPSVSHQATERRSPRPEDTWLSSPTLRPSTLSSSSKTCWHLEGMVAFVTNELYARHADLLKLVTDKPITNIKTPFKRMTYLEALDWLNARNILNEEGQPFKFGDDIAESQER